MKITWHSAKKPPDKSGDYMIAIDHFGSAYISVMGWSSINQAWNMSDYEGASRAFEIKVDAWADAPMIEDIKKEIGIEE
jgi:hypothetical protein